MGVGKIVPGFSLNSFVAPKEDWYKNLNLQDSIDMAKEKMVAAAENFVAVGYYLKHIRDGELYKNKGYENIWECARQELNLTQSTASRYISICEKFSSDGDSPYLGEKYKEYGKSQLQELLTINDQKLIEQVTPDMSVKQIQKLKRENKAGKDEHVQIEQIKEHTSEERYDALPGQMQVVLDGTFRELEDEAEQQEPESVSDIDADKLKGYDVSLVNKLICEYKGSQKNNIESKEYEYNCILDALALLKYKLECKANGKDGSLCSGKKDKNKKDIFQGDILENESGTRFEVRYGKYAMYCPIDNCMMENVGFYIVAEGYYEDMPLGPTELYATIIGNIYDNPSLKVSEEFRCLADVCNKSNDGE